MQKNEILQLLQKNYADFSAFVSAQNAVQFTSAPAGKWTSGQQTEHLFLAVRPVRLGLSLPKFFLGLFLGKSNRPSKSYDELIEKYQRKLSEGGRASKPFVPPTITASQQNKVVNQLDKEIKRLEKQLASWSEADLDIYIMPHPLLGKLTIREMLYFTAYHATHHLKSIESFS
jgi:hypothetical protein